jgi:hypothetical protein
MNVDKTCPMHQNNSEHHAGELINLMLETDIGLHKPAFSNDTFISNE